MERPSPPARPEVWVNCAVSVDGRLAFADGRRARLSSEEDLDRVHRLRATVDGILVGIGTVVRDDPSLRVQWERTGRPPGPSPTRIVVEGRGRIPEGARVLDGSAPTIVALARSSARRYPPSVRTIVAGASEVDLDELFRALAGLGLRRILVEGGARILASVLRPGRFDRLTVYYAPVLIGAGSAPPMIDGPPAAGAEELRRLRLEAVERLGEGYLATYRPPGTDRPSAP